MSWAKYFLGQQTFQVNVNRTLSQGSAIGVISFVINANDLLDHFQTGGLFYADVVKLITPHSRNYILQSSLKVSSSGSKDWELVLNSAKGQHLPIGNSPDFIT